MKKIGIMSKIVFAIAMSVFIIAAPLSVMAADADEVTVLYEADFTNPAEWQINAKEAIAEVIDGHLWVTPIGDFTAMSKSTTFNLEEDPYLCVSVDFDDDDHMWSLSLSFPDGEYIHLIINDPYGGEYEFSVIEALEDAGRDTTGSFTCNLILWAVARESGLDGHVIFNYFKMTSGPLTPPRAPAPPQESPAPESEQNDTEAAGTETDVEVENDVEGNNNSEDGLPPLVIAVTAAGAAVVIGVIVFIVIKGKRK